ncbi:hypothetical protein MIND_00938000 [Mycena indigotica]|uniref:Uncharacterized protein n=1 Tax=Mycena indigotica TaxID=2126181 RepID=A0A8H6SDP6_9AGAR|nr:uncharacterized protein MIND_00938000 [Mycena indigotica]KAF7297053.1 hypothetical protein MIND_00938000 [Mycena indigotica]
MERWNASQQYVFTTDNEVALHDLLGVGANEERDVRDDPARSSFRQGNLVEIAFNLRAAPFNKDKQVLCHLDRIIRISKEATTDLARFEETKSTSARYDSRPRSNPVKRILSMPYLRNVKQRRNQELDDYLTEQEEQEEGSKRNKKKGRRRKNEITASMNMFLYQYYVTLSSLSSWNLISEGVGDWRLAATTDNNLIP